MVNNALVIVCVVNLHSVSQSLNQSVNYLLSRGQLNYSLLSFISFNKEQYLSTSCKKHVFLYPIVFLLFFNSIFRRLHICVCVSHTICQHSYPPKEQKAYKLSLFLTFKTFIIFAPNQELMAAVTCVQSPPTPLSSI